MGRVSCPTVRALAIAAIFLAGARPLFAADEIIGSIKNAAGEAAVVRAGQTIPARAGLRLLAADALETGRDGSLGVVLRDDAVLSLGPSTRVALERFTYAPAEQRLGFVARTARGTLAYLSGIIGRLAPETVRFETPVGTLGIRGTQVAIRIVE
jgi:hypothetical protein